MFLDVPDAAHISQVSGNTLTGGTWNALNGATIEFPSGTSITTNAANVTLSGAGAGFTAEGGTTALGGGSLINSGSLTLGTGGAGAGATLNLAGSYTQTSTGTLDIQIGGTPTSGLFGQLVATGTATLAGTFNLGLVNSFVPPSGTALTYPVMSFTSASGKFTTFNGLTPYFTEALNPTSLVLSTTAGTVDLLPASVTAPTTPVTAGQNITVDWEVKNQGSEAATGNWQDSVYLSATPAITSISLLLGAVQHSGGLAANGTYSASLTAALPAQALGDYYVLVLVDSLYQVPDADRANNTLAAAKQLQISVPAITLGKPAHGTFTMAGADSYYQVTVPAGGALVVSLASSASSGSVALYVSRGSLPTPYNYQEAADVANQPHQTATVPQVATPTTYYILAESLAGAAATAGYTLTATQTGAVGVSSISSYSGGNGGNVTIEINGTNFSRKTTASLSLGGATVGAASVYYQSASQIFATFNLAQAVIGNYTLTVQDGANSASARRRSMSWPPARASRSAWFLTRPPWSAPAAIALCTSQPPIPATTTSWPPCCS